MEEANRLKLFSLKIAKTIEGRGSFVVFYNSRTERAVKFETFGPEVSFLVSIPLSANKTLQGSEIRELKSLGFEKNNFPFSYGSLLEMEGVNSAIARSIYQKFWNLQEVNELERGDLQEVSGIDKETAEEIKKSFRSKISSSSARSDSVLQKRCRPETVVELAGNIFKKVYSLPEDYSISLDLYFGEYRCFMCGCPLLRAKLITHELSIKRAREIGANEEDIKKELEKRISLLKVTHFDKPRRKLKDMIKAVREKGLIYPHVCRTCSSSLPFYPASIEL